MGNIAYEKAFRKQLKKSYKGLTAKQKAYVKAKESFEQADKELNRFYSTVKRTEYGAVDFASLDGATLDWFTAVNKNKDKALKHMGRLEEEIDVNYTLMVYQQINTHSMSF